MPGGNSELHRIGRTVIKPLKTHRIVILAVASLCFIITTCFAISSHYHSYLSWSVGPTGWTKKVGAGKVTFKYYEWRRRDGTIDPNGLPLPSEPGPPDDPYKTFREYGLYLKHHIVINYWWMSIATGLIALAYAVPIVRHLSQLRRLELRCRGCGYDLRGLTASVCPECGRTTNAGTPDTRS